MFSSFISSLQTKQEETKETDPFQLPIEYLDPKEKHSLNEVVAADLELSAPSDTDTDTDKKVATMYHHMMNPKTPFEENMISRWKNTYTTNTAFLEETQEVLKEMRNYPLSTYSPEYENIMKIWSDTKEDSNFLERYSYMEFDMFKWVNKHPSFLQSISIINMGSPVLSFLIPFVLFFMPFFIVKAQGHAITFSMYMQVLKEISRNHFIGKIISNAESMSPQNMLYIIALVGLYAYQIYQNYIACIRFYENIRRMNTQICELQSYLDSSISRMKYFAKIIEPKKMHAPFLSVLREQISQLESLKAYIKDIRPFEPSIYKIGEIGSLLGCYYEIYSNREYGAALLYSFSFQGYIENMAEVSGNIANGRLGFASFDISDLSGNPLVIKDQFYPALANESYVTNDATLEENMVITGPNAAGKTTYLKTTMLNIIFTQQFGCGFYSSCSMRPYTHIHSYLNIPDTSGRDSLFQAESRRCKEIICDVLSTDAEDIRHFCIFDELYSGTNPAEATKSAYAFLLWLSDRPNVDFILTTHYVDICARFKESKSRIANWKMDARETEEGDIEYSYKIVEGISTIQGAVKVLRDMDYPKEIIESIVSYDGEKE